MSPRIILWKTLQSRNPEEITYYVMENVGIDGEWEEIKKSE